MIQGGLQRGCEEAAGTEEGRKIAGQGRDTITVKDK